MCRGRRSPGARGCRRGRWRAGAHTGGPAAPGTRKNSTPGPATWSKRVGSPAVASPGWDRPGTGCPGTGWGPRRAAPSPTSSRPGCGCCSWASTRRCGRRRCRARPGNRFWAALHGAGCTDRRLGPSDGEALLAAGLGITNLVARATGGAHEVTAAELRAGRERLTRLVEGVQPRAVAVLGLSAYRTAFGCPHATVGRRPEPLGGEAVWPLPNPSGRAAGYQLPALVSAYAALRASLDADVAG
ncbi:MAG TPA: mismatch-specific DNA-glycosylase [Mycobacteriales bacterium]|nr:mismatch-specific DNA-glycosylase [Mycobacteriales bacterium]